MITKFAESSSDKPTSKAGAAKTTRQKVMHAVLSQGPVSAANIAKKLNLTAAAVRRHLDALESDGLVEVKVVSGSQRGAGRPSRRYVVTQQGQVELGDDYLGVGSTQCQHLPNWAAKKHFAASRSSISVISRRGSTKKSP